MSGSEPYIKNDSNVRLFSFGLLMVHSAIYHIRVEVDQLSEDQKLRTKQTRFGSLMATDIRFSH